MVCLENYTIIKFLFAFYTCLAKKKHDRVENKLKNISVKRIVQAFWFEIRRRPVSFGRKATLIRISRTRDQLFRSRRLNLFYFHSVYHYDYLEPSRRVVLIFHPVTPQNVYLVYIASLTPNIMQTFRVQRVFAVWKKMRPLITFFGTNNRNEFSPDSWSQWEKNSNVFYTAYQD